MKKPHLNVIRTVGRLLSVWCIVILCAMPSTLQAAPPVRDQLTVMSRNLYLGADVYAAAQFLPDLQAASQYLWENMQQTSCDARADAFADEVMRTRPDVIGLQEAATWYCRDAYASSARIVYDYTQLLIDALDRRGVAYMVARAPAALPSQHTGFSIPTVPYITTVRDPVLFPALFGSDTASCGFAVADVLLVHATRAGDVYRSGASDFVFDYTLVPGLVDMNRGYAWLDMHVGAQTVRVVSTHVEAFFYDNLQPYSIRQTKQLIHDLEGTTSALIVLGDFNNDPHDPIPRGQLNTGARLTASAACPAQPVLLTSATADDTCNTYWMMRHAAYADVGPESMFGANATWGYSADLSGPAIDRLLESEFHQTALGLTARLDYIFVRNGATVVTADIIGNEWPHHGWPCARDSQQQNAKGTALLLGLPYTDEHGCAPSDHAGVVATIRISDSPTQISVPPYRVAHIYAYLVGFLGSVGLLWWAVRRRRQQRRLRPWRRQPHQVHNPA